MTILIVLEEAQGPVGRLGLDDLAEDEVVAVVKEEEAIAMDMRQLLSILEIKRHKMQK